MNRVILESDVRGRGMCSNLSLLRERERMKRRPLAFP